MDVDDSSSRDDDAGSLGTAKGVVDTPNGHHPHGENGEEKTVTTSDEDKNNKAQHEGSEHTAESNTTPESNGETSSETGKPEIGDDPDQGEHEAVNTTVDSADTTIGSGDGAVLLEQLEMEKVVDAPPFGESIGTINSDANTVLSSTATLQTHYSAPEPESSGSILEKEALEAVLEDENSENDQKGHAVPSRKRHESTSSVRPSEMIHTLYKSYPTWLSVLFMLLMLLYIAAYLYSLAGVSFTVGKGSEQVRMTLYEFIKSSWVRGAYTTSVLITLFSVILPIFLIVALFVVWFASLQLRTRSRILRWVSRLAIIPLFFYLYVVIYGAFLEVAFSLDVEFYATSGSTVYVSLFVTLGLITLTEWIYVLHYNSISPKPYFGSNKACKNMCCLASLDHFEKKASADVPLKRTPSRGAIRRTEDGWEILEQSYPYSKQPCCTWPSVVGEIHFKRGSYLYACSTCGILMGFLWAAAIAALGIAGFIYPVVQINLDVDVFNSTTNVLTKHIVVNGGPTIATIGSLIVEVNAPASLYVISVFYYLLVAVVPTLFHLLATASLFLPIERVMGRRALRAICHTTTLLLSFSAYPVAVFTCLVVVVDFENTILGNAPMLFLNYFYDEEGAICYTDNDMQGTFATACCKIRPDYGMAFGILAVILNYPYLYYFAESVHRHFGLVADGRNDISMKDGRATHKHRFEGCLVWICYLSWCCSRKEYTFRQESIDENDYYGEEQSGTFNPAMFRFSQRYSARWSTLFGNNSSRSSDDGSHRFSPKPGIDGDSDHDLESQREHGTIGQENNLDKKRSSIKGDRKKSVRRRSSAPHLSSGHDSEPPVHLIFDQHDVHRDAIRDAYIEATLSNT